MQFSHTAAGEGGRWKPEAEAKLSGTGASKAAMAAAREAADDGAAVEGGRGAAFATAAAVAAVAVAAATFAPGSRAPHTALDPEQRPVPRPHNHGHARVRELALARVRVEDGRGAVRGEGGGDGEGAEQAAAAEERRRKSGGGRGRVCRCRRSRAVSSSSFSSFLSSSSSSVDADDGAPGDLDARQLGVRQRGRSGQERHPALAAVGRQERNVDFDDEDGDAAPDAEPPPGLVDGAAAAEVGEDRGGEPAEALGGRAASSSSAGPGVGGGERREVDRDREGPGCRSVFRRRRDLKGDRRDGRGPTAAHQRAAVARRGGQEAVERERKGRVVVGASCCRCPAADSSQGDRQVPGLRRGSPVWPRPLGEVPRVKLCLIFFFFVGRDREKRSRQGEGEEVEKKKKSSRRFF